jgi:hypothetical protein
MGWLLSGYSRLPILTLNAREVDCPRPHEHASRVIFRVRKMWLWPTFDLHCGVYRDFIQTAIEMSGCSFWVGVPGSSGL